MFKEKVLKFLSSQWTKALEGDKKDEDRFKNLFQKLKVFKNSSLSDSKSTLKFLLLQFIYQYVSLMLSTKSSIILSANS